MLSVLHVRSKVSHGHNFLSISWENKSELPWSSGSMLDSVKDRVIVTDLRQVSCKLHLISPSYAGPNLVLIVQKSSLKHQHFILWAKQKVARMHVIQIEIMTVLLILYTK